jgi:dihydrofolate synthase/folylpolyglutamate synthase
MQFLGETLPEIAAEKAGIIKRGCPVFCPHLSAPAMKVVRARAGALKAPLTVSAAWKTVRVDWRNNVQVFAGPRGERARLSLLGAGQASNVALARSVLDGLLGVLPVSDKAWEAGLSEVKWPGRFLVRPLGRRTLILDGAHNPEAMANLADTWRLSPWFGRKSRWIVGVMRDKDVAGILKPIAPFLRDVVTVRPPSPRALEPVTLARAVRRLVPQARVTIEHDPQTALDSWLKAPGPATAVVCGSFYLVGAATDALRDLHAAN